MLKRGSIANFGRLNRVVEISKMRGFFAEFDCSFPWFSAAGIGVNADESAFRSHRGTYIDAIKSAGCSPNVTATTIKPVSIPMIDHRCIGENSFMKEPRSTDDLC